MTPATDLPSAAPASPPPSAAPPPTVVRDEAETRRLLRRRRNRRRAVVGGAVGAVVIVLLLVFTGVIPLLGGSAAQPGLTFSQARTLAVAAAPPAYGTAPTILGATAVASRTGTTVAAASFSTVLTSSCTVTELSGYPPGGTLQVPSFSGGFDSGRAPFWAFVFEQSASGPYAIVAVVNATASPIAELSGSNCQNATLSPQPLPGNVVDSPVAAAAAWDHTGSIYVSSGSNVTTLTMTAFGGGTVGLLSVPAVWLFLYAPCTPLSGGTTNQTAWIVTLGLTSAALPQGTGYTVRCPT